MIQKCFVGIDISKEKIDVACIDNDYTVVFEKIICNSESKIRTLLVSTMRKLKLSKKEILVCCEQTGIYNRNLVQTTSKLILTLIAVSGKFWNKGGSNV